MQGLDLLDEKIVQNIRDKKNCILNHISGSTLQLLVSLLASRNILGESDNLAILSKPSMLEQASAFIDKIVEIRSKAAFQQLLYVLEDIGLETIAAELDIHNIHVPVPEESIRPDNNTSML